MVTFLINFLSARQHIAGESRTASGVFQNLLALEVAAPSQTASGIAESTKAFQGLIYEKKTVSDQMIPEIGKADRKLLQFLNCYRLKTPFFSDLPKSASVVTRSEAFTSPTKTDFAFGMHVPRQSLTMPLASDSLIKPYIRPSLCSAQVPPQTFVMSNGEKWDLPSKNLWMKFAGSWESYCSSRSF